jgi:hypothetical protein
MLMQNAESNSANGIHYAASGIVAFCVLVLVVLRAVKREKSFI